VEATAAVVIAVEEVEAMAIAAAVVVIAVEAVVVEATAAVEVAAVHIVVVEVAEVHTAVEAPALTVDTNLSLKFKGPPPNSGRAFCFS